MIKHARRLHRAGDELWRGVRAADRSSAAERVAALRRRYPNAGEAALHRHLVQSKCIQAGVVGALGSLAGCSQDDTGEVTTAQTVQTASVSIVMQDESGLRVGGGSGILLGPRVVLTSGHLITGAAKWTVTSGSATATFATSRR